MGPEGFQVIIDRAVFWRWHDEQRPSTAVACTPPAVSSASRFVRAGPQRRRDAALGHQRLGHPVAEVVAGALRDHASGHEPRRRAHAARRDTGAGGRGPRVEVGLDGAAEERLQLAQPVVLPAGIAEVVGGANPGATAWAACTASPSLTSSSRSVARLPVDQ